MVYNDINNYKVDKFVPIKTDTHKIKYKFDVPLRADQYELMGVVITFAKDSKIVYEEKNNDIKNANLTLSVAGFRASCTTLGFLAKSEEHIIYHENTLSIMLPDNTRHPCDLSSLPSNLFSYEIDIDFSDITDISAIGNYRIIKDFEKRNQLAKHPHNQIIPINNSKLLESENLSYVLKTMLTFTGFTRGYFIFGDIDNLENVTLLLNGYERWNYNKMMITLIGTRINKNMLYLSFDGTHHSVKCTSPDTGLNCSGIDQQIITLTFSTLQTSATVFNHSCAILEYKNNICNVIV